MIYPLEITKTRLALAESKVYSGIFDCIRKIIHFEGARSLYKGLSASLLGIVPYASVDLAIFNLLKDTYIKRIREKPSVIGLLTCGGLAGMIG